jgi:hypothetical protein
MARKVAKFLRYSPVLMRSVYKKRSKRYRCGCELDIFRLQSSKQFWGKKNIKEYDLKIVFYADLKM